ncbi:MAG: type II toxin-antitoxin system RelE/ParE family toxin [Nitrosomonas sp.]|nr:type II toxin-antitoxin system RelE/ParE family toxin [Nitrosomonas sp.]
MYFHQAASVELVEAAEFYDSKVAGLGESFVIEVQLIVSFVQEQPLVGSNVFKNFRSIVLARFPYSVVYMVESERILVLAIAHQRRRPGYWRDRTRSTADWREERTPTKKQPTNQ